jgi:hypothetical protein
MNSSRKSGLVAEIRVECRCNNLSTKARDRPGVATCYFVMLDTPSILERTERALPRVGVRFAAPGSLV